MSGILSCDCFFRVSQTLDDQVEKPKVGKFLTFSKLLMDSAELVEPSTITSLY